MLTDNQIASLNRLHRGRRSLVVAALLACATFSITATDAFAAPYSGLVVFGDSLSDVGNIASSTLDTYPGQYYYQDRFSNGPVYTDALSAGLGLGPSVRSTAGGSNYAYGGAQTTGTGGFNGLFIRDVDEQVGNYLAAHTPDANALFVVFSGANDFFNGQTDVNIPANSLADDIGRLITAGARQFLVMNLPLLGYTPRYNGNASTLSQYNALTVDFNAALDTKIDTFAAANPALTFFRLDVAAKFNEVRENPAEFGLTNVTQAAAPGLQPGASSYNTNQIVANPNQYLFWDTIHPTTTGHTVLAQLALDLVALPGDYNRDGTVDAADYVVWRNSFGQIGSFLRADGNGNNQIDEPDFDFWRAHFGQSAFSANAAYLASGESSGIHPFTIPEPNAFVMLCTALIACINRSRLRAARSPAPAAFAK